MSPGAPGRPRGAAVSAAGDRARAHHPSRPSPRLACGAVEAIGAEKRPSLSVVIVAYGSGEDLGRTLPALARELGAEDELIVVDNDPGRPVGAVVSEHAA